jgi:hypothetical protein
MNKNSANNFSAIKPRPFILFAILQTHTKMQALQKLSKIASTARRSSSRLMQTSMSTNLAESQSNKKDDVGSQIDSFTKEFNERKIVISDFQRALLAVGSSVSALLDPRRHDMIACLGETTGVGALKQIYDKMAASEEGRQILDDMPRINTKTVNLDALKTMSENTLGHQYWKFLADNVRFHHHLRDVCCSFRFFC